MKLKLGVVFQLHKPPSPFSLAGHLRLKVQTWFMLKISRLFSGWPVRHRLMLVGALFVFWIMGFRFSLQHGNTTFHRTDGASEGIGIHAANYFYDHGFLKTYFLPMSPAFGFDQNGLQRTEPFVYTHYFPGPSLILGGVMKAFGRDAAWSARLVPLTLTCLALFFLALQFAAYFHSSSLSLLFTGLLLTARSLTIFSVGWWGQGYVLAFYLFALGLLFALANAHQSTKKISSPAVFAAFTFIGFLQMEFAIDWMPLTFLACAAFFLILEKLPRTLLVPVLGGLFIGGCSAMFLQLVLSSFYYGSFSATVADFLNFGKWRMGMKNIGANDAPLETFRLARVLKEYNNQAYGATGFTAVGQLVLTGAFLLMGWAGKVRTNKSTQRLLAGILLSYLAAAAWNILMRQHSMVHVHFIPRHYFALFAAFLLIALPIAQDLVRAARSNKAS